MSQQFDASRWRLTRRQVLGIAGAGASSLVLAACGGGRTMGGTRTDTSDRSGSVLVGGAWTEPQVIASRDGLLDTTLTLTGAMVPYGAGTRWALTVNGMSPGPTLRLRPGDRLRLVLDNRTQHTTNLHTHGLHVSPSGNSDNPFLEVRPGQKFAYEIGIPKDHPGGLHWYHPHIHQHSAEQLFAGLFGAIVVEDDFDAMPEVAAAHERILLLHDAHPGKNESSVMRSSMMEQMAGREGSVVLVNGEPVPEIAATTGTLERWRILNASTSRFYRLHIEGHTFQVIGSDGGRLKASRSSDSLGLVPGERVEVLIQPTEPGTYRLTTAAVERGGVGMGMGGGRSGAAGSRAADILRLVVSGEHSAAPRLPSLTTRFDDLRQAPSERTRDVVFSMEGMGGGMTPRIDGRSFDSKRVDIRARLGSVEEWTIRNTSMMDHPFHLHVWPFQVVAQSSGTPQPGWKDVVRVPAGGWVRIRVRFADIVGKSVYHCHILDHEDLGMMGVIEVA